MAKKAKNPYGQVAGGKYTPNVGAGQRTSQRGTPAKTATPPVPISLNTKKYGKKGKKN